MTRDEALTVLGLSAEYAPDEFVSAYRAQARRRHPDQGGSRESWDELQAARAVLIDSDFQIELQQQHEQGDTSGPAWWRQWSRLRRVPVTAAGGPALVGVWWLLDAGYPIQDGAGAGVVPLAIVAYLGVWWLWWLVREVRTPVRARSARWVWFFPDAGLGARMAEAMEQEQATRR